MWLWYNSAVQKQPRQQNLERLTLIVREVLVLLRQINQHDREVMSKFDSLFPGILREEED